MTAFVPTGGPLLRPPKIETMVIAYLAPLLAPVPVVTRMPKPNATDNTVNALLRVEAGGGNMANKTQWDMTILLSAYSPDEDEANGIACDACDLMARARGQTIDGFYIVTVEDVDVPHRQTDPDVILPRYFATATWRVAGQPWNPTP